MRSCCFCAKRSLSNRIPQSRRRIRHCQALLSSFWGWVGGGRMAVFVAFHRTVMGLFFGLLHRLQRSLTVPCLEAQGNHHPALSSILLGRSFPVNKQVATTLGTHSWVMRAIAVDPLLNFPKPPSTAPGVARNRVAWRLRGDGCSER